MGRVSAVNPITTCRTSGGLSVTVNAPTNMANSASESQRLAPSDSPRAAPGSLAGIVIRSAGFLAWFDLIGAMGASGFFKEYLGEWYVLMQPQTAVLVTTLMYAGMRAPRVERGLLVAAGAFVSVGFYEYMATLTTGQFTHVAFLQLLFGFLYPAWLIVFVATLDTEGRLLFWRWFYGGLCVMLCTGLVLLAVDGIFLRQVLDLGWGGAIISLRYAYQDSLFALTMGNANKQSNYLILALLVAPTLLGLARASGKPSEGSLRLFRVASVLAIAMILLRFSRLVVLILPVVIYLNRRYLFGRWSTGGLVAVGLGTLIVGATTVGAEQIGTVFRYLFFSEYLGGEAGGLIGTGSSRFNRWAILWTQFGDVTTGLFGIGYGAYGEMNRCADCGTHNLFLDHWIASGAYGVLVLSALTVVVGAKSLLRSDFGIAMASGVFVILAVREYSMAYLHTTSMGGLMFMTLLYCVYVGDVRKVRRASEGMGHTLCTDR
jgi:hypothetical protein